jgi:hypothetical protein
MLTNGLELDEPLLGLEAHPDDALGNGLGSWRLELFVGGILYLIDGFFLHDITI